MRREGEREHFSRHSLIKETGRERERMRERERDWKRERKRERMRERMRCKTLATGGGEERRRNKLGWVAGKKNEKSG